MKYRVTLNNKSYEVEVEKGAATLINEYQAVTLASTPVTAPVTVSPAPANSPAPVVSAPSPAASPAPIASANASAAAVKAPIAGTVLSIKANVGASVKRGSTILIIEAMKMENEIVSPKDGTLSALYVQQGASVATGTILFEIA